MPEQRQRPVQYFVKRVAFNEYSQIIEVEFYDSVPYTPEEIAAFIRQYDTRLKRRDIEQSEVAK